MPTINEDIALINSVWGSESDALQQLEAEAKKLFASICDEPVSIPEIQLRPSMMANGILFSDGLRSGEYEPSIDNSTAIIALYPSVLDNKENTRIALAHELIHHWEHVCNTKQYEVKYPADVDKIISSLFSTEQKMRKWRSGHTKVFIAKASEVASLLNISLQKMLVDH